MDIFDNVTIEIFNEYVNDLVTHETSPLIEITDDIYETLIHGNKWPKEDVLEIIKYICNINDQNELENNGFITYQSEVKFKEDEEFGGKALYYYISTNFKDACAINMFNSTVTDYSTDLSKNESSVVEYMAELLEDSDDKYTILRHIFNTCEIEIEDLDEDLDEDYLNAILNYYFYQTIFSDFHCLRFHIYCQEAIDSYKDNENETLQELYNKIMSLDEEYDYSEIIIDILEILGEDPNNYNKFKEDEEFGQKILRRYFEESLLDFDVPNPKKYKYINEIARGFLEEIVKGQKDERSICITLDYYFQHLDSENEKKFRTLNKYGISLKEIQIVQKICLISDYYNYNSDLVFDSLCINEISKHQVQKEYNDDKQEIITFIKENNLRHILNRFNNDNRFRFSCLISFACNKNESYSICDDDKTIQRINPYFILERINNKTYQKRID